MRIRQLLRSGAVAASLATAAGLTSCALAGQASARFVTAIPWATTGQWIAIDTHVHTRFSDGASTVAEVVERARQFGCQAIAITDHADRQLSAATPEYQKAIEGERAAHPGFPIVAGLEWNIPPRGGDEHAGLLVAPGPQEWTTLSEFKRRFDDYDLPAGRPKPDVGEALRWLGALGGEPPVVIDNHPSRRDPSSMDNLRDMLAWRAVNGLVVGFEGAPGHQGHEPIGSYTDAVRTIDRWDPVAARVGDAWDSLLQRGVDVFAALANSDFHNANVGDLNDRWPCQFAETWLRVPELTASGILRALRAGAAFAVHGHIARDVELTMAAPGLARPAIAGEVIAAPTRTPLTVSLAFEVPARDWEDKPNRVDAVEFIVIAPDGVKVMSQPVGSTGRQTVSETLVVPPGGLVVRARGRRIVDGGPALMFYTNPIRVKDGR